MDAQLHMDVQALVNRAEQANKLTAELVEERNRMRCRSVDETFIPFRRELAAKQAQAKAPAAAAPQQAIAAEQHSEPADREQYSSIQEDAALFTGAMLGTLFLIMLVAHGAGWLLGGK